MPFFYPLQSKRALLELWLDAFTLGNYKLKLYRAAVVLSDALVLADLVEATFSGYAAGVLDTWSPILFDLDNRGYAKNLTIVFEHDGGGIANTVYGAYVESDGAELVGVMPLPDGPHAMGAAGDKIEVEPLLYLGVLPQL